MSLPEQQVMMPQRQDDSMLSFVMSIEEAKRRVAQLQEFIKSVMVKDEDYGTIPGTPKPTLLKPGAEKLCEIYGLAPTVEVTSRMEDWEKGFFSYEVRCRLISKRTGNVVAEGLGSANSKEKRYQKQDPYTLVNTILKMAKKRALVDAALSATRSSGIFTQDIEDITDELPHDTGQQKQTKPNANSSNLISDSQRGFILKLVGHWVKSGSVDDKVKFLHERFDIDLDKLSKKEASDIIELIQDSIKEEKQVQQEAAGQ